MKTITIKGISFIFVCLMILSLCVCGVSASNVNTSNRFNVCFVLDSTNSLLDTDKEKLRYDATNMFLGLLANEGNYVGSVIFSGGVIKKNEIVPINGPQDKKTAETNLETNEQLGATTIGEALDVAVDMILVKGDNSLPSVVILLSDGQSNKENTDEMTSRSEALAKAKTNKIPIYTVALNADGEADLEVLEQIANATNGKYQEVKKSDDLKDVFKDFYNMIYSTGTINIKDGTVPEDGVISVDFKVPYQGVEEINIIIASDNKIKNLKLEKPDGTEISSKEIDDLTTDAKRFSITKITKPVGGDWTLKGEGDPNSHIKIDMVYNDLITVKTDYYEKKEIYGVGETVTVNGLILNDGKNLKGGYENYSAWIVPDTENGKKIQMSLDSDKFVGTITFDDEGTYTYHMEIEGNGLKKETETGEIVLNVGNLPPEIKEEGKDFSEHFWVFPFFTKTCEVDLTKAVTDPDGEPLKFEVVSSTFKNTTYEIDGDKLVIKDFYDLSKGICTIRAKDAKNAFAEFDVTVSLTNVGIITIIVVGVGAIVVIGVLVGLGYWLSRKKFMGPVTVTNIETGASMTLQRNKGHINLSSFQVGATGLSPKARFQATGKAHIEFRCPKPVSSSVEMKKVKKITIKSQQDVIIYSDDAKEHGIQVRFESYLDSM